MIKVLKFGGTSVGSALGMSCIRKIVDHEQGSAVVVVSALGGVTDMLLGMASAAASGDERAWRESFTVLGARHNQAIEDSVDEELRSAAREFIEPLVGELETALRGVTLLGELSARSSALIVSYGERMSSGIVHHMLRGSKFVDSREVFKTHPYFNRHIVDFSETGALIRRIIDPQQRVTVMGGFIASDLKSGQVTNLGRGGSDYTAAILAAVLGAKLLEIYTDVDGFMTADPRVVSSARLIESMNFVNSMELCNLGAKVLYSPTIFPAYNLNIPIVIKNTFNRASSGTFIDSHCGGADTVVGLSSISNVTLLTICGLQNTSSDPATTNNTHTGSRNFSYRLFKALAKAGVSPFLESITPQDDISLGLTSAAEQEVVTGVLNSEFAQEIAMGHISGIRLDSQLAALSLVGNNLSASGSRQALLEALSEAHISIISQGVTQQNSVCVIVPQKQLAQALKTAHSLFFEKQHTHRRVIINGQTADIAELYKIIEKNNDRLIAKHNVRLLALPYHDNFDWLAGDILVDINEFDTNFAKKYPELITVNHVRILSYNSAVAFTLNDIIPDDHLLQPDFKAALGIENSAANTITSFNNIEDPILTIKAILPTPKITTPTNQQSIVIALKQLLNYFAGANNKPQIHIEFCDNYNTNPKIEIFSHRFSHYPLTIWTKKINNNTIYHNITQFL